MEIARRLGEDQPLGDMLEELASASELLDGAFYELLRDGAWLESKVSEGGTSLARVREQLTIARRTLASSGDGDASPAG